MTVKTDLKAEEETLLLEMLAKLEKLNKTISKPKEGSPSHADDIVRSGQNTLSKVRSFLSKLNRPNIKFSTMDIVSLIFCGVFFFLMSREMDRRACNTCWKQGEAHALASRPCPIPPVVVVREPGIYTTADGRLTKIGNVL